jgi:DNA-directed RNA polymerase subunit H (RpoH/RPB5)
MLSSGNSDIASNQIMLKQDGYILFRVKQTQVEMMEDRGLKIPSHERELFLSYNPEEMPVIEWERKTIPQFVEHYGEIARKENKNFNTILSQVYIHPDTGIKTVVAYLFRDRESATISTAEFQSTFDYYRNKYSTKGLPLNMVFISEVPVKSKQVKDLNLIKTQFFVDEQLLVNPTRHDFYQPHRKLTEEERKTMIEDNNIQIKELPILSLEDPITQYFNWKEGDLILIHRKQRFLEIPAPESVYIRQVKKLA